jgi:hypothetical protein
MNWRRAIAIWLLILAAESISGTIRRMWLVPALGEHTAHQIGVVAASALILFIAWLTARWLDARTFKAQFQVGMLWVVLMLCFEFGVGLAIGNSMQSILAEYDLSRGGLMGLGFLVLLFAPVLGARVAKVCKLPLENGHAN